MDDFLDQTTQYRTIDLILLKDRISGMIYTEWKPWGHWISEFKRLYLSIISAASEYPLEIEVNDHFVILYELDGYPIDTIKARRLYLQPGETAKIGLEKMNDDSNDLFVLRLSLPGNTL